MRNDLLAARKTIRNDTIVDIISADQTRNKIRLGVVLGSDTGIRIFSEHQVGVVAVSTGALTVAKREVKCVEVSLIPLSWGGFSPPIPADSMSLFEHQTGLKAVDKFDEYVRWMESAINDMFREKATIAQEEAVEFLV